VSESISFHLLNTMLTQLITRISLMCHLFMYYIISLSPVHYLIKLYETLMYYVLLTISLVLDMAVDIRKMLEGATLERKVSKKLAWHKATADHIMQYRTYLHNVWKDVNLSYCSLLCRDFTCTDSEHLSALNTYASYLTSVLKLYMNTFFAQKKRASSGHLPGWNSGVIPRKINLYFGTIYGLTVADPGQDILLILCAVLGQPTIERYE